jgi:hypothetical protein
MKQMEFDLPGSVELGEREKKEVVGEGWLTPYFRSFKNH